MAQTFRASTAPKEKENAPIFTPKFNLDEHRNIFAVSRDPEEYQKYCAELAQQRRTLIRSKYEPKSADEIIACMDFNKDQINDYSRVRPVIERIFTSPLPGASKDVAKRILIDAFRIFAPIKRRWNISFGFILYDEKLAEYRHFYPHR
jgi:hypothetical protein